MARVKKVMLTNVPTLKKEASILDAAKLLVKDGSGCIVILHNNRIPFGIVTELDIVRKVISEGKSLNDHVTDIMNYPVTHVTPNMDLDEALKIIDTKSFRRFPVVENDELVGLVTQKDVVTVISSNLKLHRTIQNAVLVLFILFELFVFIFYKYLGVRR